MKSLMVTVLVLSSLGHQSWADKPEPSKAAPSTDRTDSNRSAVVPAQKTAPTQVKLQTPLFRPTKVAPKTPVAKVAPQAPAVKTVTPQAPAQTTLVKATPKTAPVTQPVSSEQKPVISQPTTIPQQKAPIAQAPTVKTTAPAHSNPVVLQAPGKSAPAQPPAPAATQVPAKPAVPQAPVPHVQNKTLPPPPILPVITRGAPTPAQLHQVQLNNQRLMQQNPHIRTFVDQRAQFYRNNFHTELVVRQQRYLAPAYFAPLRVQFRPWVQVGFYAYAYPVRPVVEFYTYFNNPCVSWFYNDYDEEFYRPYYGSYINRYPELGRGYAHVGIFFPTEEFMALNVSLSGMPIRHQVHYRRAMEFLSMRLSERLRMPIGRHEVVINHYQMLPNNRAVVVEGFVDSPHAQIPFRALVDLYNADNSQLFAVGGWKAGQPLAPEMSEDLFYLNDQVVDYGGALEAEPAY